MGKRYNRYGTRLLLVVDSETACSIPLQWTDLVAPDPEIILGQGRSFFRISDLLELERLVVRLKSGRAGRTDDV